MNWLKKIAQPMPIMAPMPQVALTPDQMMKIIDDILLNEGSDLNYAEQQFRNSAPVPQEVCQRINESAGGFSPERPDPSARPKMQKLAEAGACYWNPANPPMAQQPDMMNDPSMMPMMGQQEKPMDIPSTEIE